CLCLHWCNLMFQEEYDVRVRSTQKHCVSVVESQHNQRQERPKLKPQVPSRRTAIHNSKNSFNIYFK
ncbi:jg4259, partial [Pararge aegeria aegeria]